MRRSARRVFIAFPVRAFLVWRRSGGTQPGATGAVARTSTRQGLRFDTCATPHPDRRAARRTRPPRQDRASSVKSGGAAAVSVRNVVTSSRLKLPSCRSRIEVYRNYSRCPHRSPLTAVAMMCEFERSVAVAIAVVGCCEFTPGRPKRQTPSSQPHDRRKSRGCEPSSAASQCCERRRRPAGLHPPAARGSATNARTHRLVSLARNGSR